MGDADMSLDALNVAAMNVIDPRSVKSSITADHASQGNWDLEADSIHVYKDNVLPA